MSHKKKIGLMLHHPASVRFLLSLKFSTLSYLREAIHSPEVIHFKHVLTIVRKTLVVKYFLYYPFHNLILSFVKSFYLLYSLILSSRLKHLSCAR